MNEVPVKIRRSMTKTAFFLSLHQVFNLHAKICFCPNFERDIEWQQEISPFLLLLGLLVEFDEMIVLILVCVCILGDEVTHPVYLGLEGALPQLIGVCLRLVQRHLSVLFFSLLGVFPSELLGKG